MGLGLFSGEQFPLAKNGKTDYSIVYGIKEKEAADELKLHLDKITGANFPLVKDGEPVRGPGIYLGSTAFAGKQGLDGKQLEPEEWMIRGIGKDLVLIGGKRHGTLNAVYDLLENHCGCRWFAWDTTVIPKNPNLSMGAIDVRKKPSFDSREIFDDYHSSWELEKEITNAKRLFRKRIGASGDYGFMAYCPRHSRQYYDVHNFYRMLDPKVYFKNHPEYFSMDKNGKRFYGNVGPEMGGGNFCLTNPDVRNIVTENLIQFIKKDRASLQEDQWPDIYSLSPQDSDPNLCLCTKCAALEEKEGKMGLLLDFVNDIAGRIAKKYPDILIRTESYATWTEPPKTIQPAKNVIIKWCNLYGYNDCYRPITHPLNAGQKAQFDRWTKTGARLFARVYWNMGGQFFNPARVETMVDAIAPDLRYFHQHGVTMYFAEFQLNEGDNLQNFAPLQSYLGFKLMMDVRLDENKLIADFMKGYFGPAEKPMTDFLDCLRKAVAESKDHMTSTFTARNYCTEKFMKQAWEFLDEAFRLTKPGTVFRDHVEREMLSPLYVILGHTEWKIGSREKMIAQYTAIRKRLLENYNDSPSAAKRKKAWEESLQADMNSFILLNLPVPEQFKGRKVKILGWTKLQWNNGTGYKGQIVDDSDSVTGKAMGCRKDIYGKPAPLHSLAEPGVGNMYSTSVGIHDRTTKQSIAVDLKDNVPEDEKYHWYKIGTYDIHPGSFLWAYYWHSQCPLGSCWQPDDGLPGLNRWEVWVSLKFTGPAYVNDSKKPNDILWDQVLLVRPDSQKNSIPKD